jgi:adhesin HecA-like repeat protein
MLDQSPKNQGTRRTGREGACYTGDGTDDEVIWGDIGTAIWFSGWVKLNSDNQCLFSLSNDTATNLIVTAGVLTAGATLTLSAIKIDNASKTASEAGVLLNDNAWHFLSCGIGDGLGGASTADDVRFFTDGTAHGSISGFDWRFYSTTPTAAE